MFPSALILKTPRSLRLDDRGRELSLNASWIALSRTIRARPRHFEAPLAQGYTGCQLTRRRFGDKIPCAGTGCAAAYSTGRQPTCERWERASAHGGNLTTDRDIRKIVALGSMGRNNRNRSEAGTHIDACGVARAVDWFVAGSRSRRKPRGRSEMRC